MSKRRQKPEQQSYMKMKCVYGKFEAKGSAADKLAEKIPEVLEMCHRQKRHDKAFKILDVFIKLGSLVRKIATIIHDLFPYNYYQDGYEFKKMQTI